MSSNDVLLHFSEDILLLSKTGCILNAEAIKH
jgi:hypothetical protein